MSTERDLFLAKGEMLRRLEWAAEERLARQARAEAQRREAAEGDKGSERGNAFGWLRRLAGGV